MTDKERLQKLFDAALQDNFTCEKPPTRAFPAARTSEAAKVVEEVSVAEPEPVQIAAAPAPAVASDRDFVKPMENAGLDEASSAELAALLDAQLKRVARKRRRDLVMTLLVFFGLAGGWFGWFVHSPDRVAAFKAAMAEIRSAGDIKGMVEKYQAALDKIATRGDQINESTRSLGIDPDSVSPDDDPHMAAETELFTGEKGGGVAECNKKFTEKFGKMVESPLMAEGVKAAGVEETPAKQ